MSYIRIRPSGGSSGRRIAQTLTTLHGEPRQGQQTDDAEPGLRKTDVDMATISPPGTWATEYIAGPPRLAVDKQGIGPLLVLMHGIGGNRTNWHDQFGTFAAHFTVVSWDARGYGNSDDYDGPLNPIAFSHDLKRLLDFYGVQKAHIAASPWAA